MDGRRTLVVNFKGYSSGFEKGKEIATACGKLLAGSGIDAIVAPPATMLREISEVTRTFSQHAEPYVNGSHTGRITVAEIGRSGADGSFLNHSESTMGGTDIRKAARMLREKGLESMLFVETAEAARNFLLRTGKFECRPEYIVFEPHEMIGGDIPVCVSHRQEIILFANIAEEAGSIPLVGAGIRTPLDVERSMDLGVGGVVVSSGIMLASDPVKEIWALAKALGTSP
ncbi:MAG: triose-phosphate isomerase [Candidatus Micrarchaeota archaeon]|nr:triose-phosphate isomerase [Candidatus Micrarchaeota archaeon]